MYQLLYFRSQWYQSMRDSNFHGGKMLGTPSEFSEASAPAVALSPTRMHMSTTAMNMLLRKFPATAVL